VWYRVEECLEVYVIQLSPSSLYVGGGFADSIMGRPSWPKPMAAILKICLKDRLQDDTQAASSLGRYMYNQVIYMASTSQLASSALDKSSLRSKLITSFSIDLGLNLGLSSVISPVAKKPDGKNVVATDSARTSQVQGSLINTEGIFVGKLC